MTQGRKKRGDIVREHPAVVLGMFDTGMGAGRSLGRNGINVFGFDVRRDIGFYSKYIKGEICPCPVEKEDEFIDFLIDFSKKQKIKPVLLITADYYLRSVSRNRDRLQKHYLLNIAKENIIEATFDKFKQVQLAKEAGVSVPKTYLPGNLDEVYTLADEITYPAFIKGQDVNSWREKIGSDYKGIVVDNKEDLIENYKAILNKNITAIVQEVIPGPDTNHYKVCAYISKDSEVLLSFTLQKIRQAPMNFGVGSCVKSVHFPELMDTGMKLLKNINYTGVGSAEFKINERDGKLYFIELNMRYWQQNSLSEKCGMNFPLADYLYVTGQNPVSSSDFRENIKWVNIFLDSESFMGYKDAGQLTFSQWMKTLKGSKVFSNFVLDDLKPTYYGFRYRKNIMKAPNKVIRYIVDRQSAKYPKVPQKAKY